ncbi:MAG TPA: SRPBCC domain-containing protein [Xanthobacteraceae bacterium]|nr:SRPBCC domain-containing protein [Xanthobacteraceae bacterium]
MSSDSANKNPVENATKEFVITRTFNAPRELVFKAFTEPERMKEWWGPKGFTVIASKMDLRPGGTYHYGMRAPDGKTMWGKFVYREIVRPERIVLVNSFSDEAGGLTRHPMSPTWPLEMLSTFLFADKNGRTELTIKWLPLNADEKERATFDGARDSMKQGWSGTLDQLDAFLKKT